MTDDRLSLFYMPAELRETAAERARKALDAPAVCPHLPAPLICVNHAGEGSVCVDCAAEHVAELLADPRCALCRIRWAEPGMLNLPYGEYSVLARLCRECVAGPGVAAPEGL